MKKSVGLCLLVLFLAVSLPRARAYENDLWGEPPSRFNPTWFVAPYGAYSIGVGSEPTPDDTAGGGLAFHLDFIRLYGEFLTTLDDWTRYYYGGGADLCIVLVRHDGINPYIGGGGGFYGFSNDEFENVEMAYVVEGLAGIRLGYFNFFAKYRRFVWTEADFADGWDYVQVGGGFAF
ncbi:MAG TPA: hypothetical protein P5567_06200 [Kiritimatiellia bacterium]|nr:hypothetical protein [Kiritimatiellia bacterium]HRZ12029.1 hypothetical protein [Kiritimatiellia bacterium]HSA17165.1 hypothetical protein [Kiritimatiellia bacterium]